MRKLKLQMVVSLDGFVEGKYGGADIDWDKAAFECGIVLLHYIKK